MKKISLTFLTLASILLSLGLVSSASWEEGSLHQHTGYSTWDGYDGVANNNDDCEPNLLELHQTGYTVAELKEHAMNDGLDWLAFSDHSYCIDSSEFDTVKNDCQNAQSGSFSCLWGEELSTQDMAGDDESWLVRYCENPTTGEAHMGGYGVDSLVGQTPPAVHCPTTPTAQNGITSINSHGGFTILNHPFNTELGTDFLDFDNIDGVTGEKGIEIWNGVWSNDDSLSRNKWVDKIQGGERIYAYGGTDEHGYPSRENYNIVSVASLTHSDLESGLGSGTSLLSNNGYVILEAKRNTQSTWTQMGGEILATQNEQLNIRLSYGVENSCTLKVYSSPTGNPSYLESVYTWGAISGSGEVNINYPLATNGGFYYRAECVSSNGEKRIYTNPIWVTVGSGGSCTAWQGSTCGPPCNSDEVYQTRTCNGVPENRCQYSSLCEGSGRTACTPPICPGGYNNQGTSCEPSGSYLRCTRTCYQAGYCGAYGSWQQRGTTFLNWAGSSNRGAWIDGADLFEDSDYCYQYYGETQFDVSGWGTTNSYTLRSRTPFNTNSICVVYPSDPSIVTTSTYTQGRGINTNRDADGYAYDYGGSTCSGGTPFNDLEGMMDVDLNYRTAFWNPENYNNQICDVPYVQDIDIVGILYNNIDAQCYVEIRGSATSNPDRIEAKWYVNGNYVGSGSCTSGCDDNSGSTWSNTFELNPSYFSIGDEIYCTGRGRGEHGGYSAYDQSGTQSVINRVPIWSSVSLNKDYAKQGESIIITANNEDDLDGESLDMYCCNGAGCTPSTSNFDFCFTNGNNPPYNLQCTGEGLSGDGTKYVQCKLYDGHDYSTVQSDTYAADNTAPSISNPTINISSAYLNEYARITCTVTDSGSGLNSIWLEADKPVSTNQNYTMSVLTESIYYKDIQLNEEGLWGFNCWANDSLNNMVNKTVGTVNVISDKAPQIYFVSPTPANGSEQSSSSILVNISTNDNENHYALVDFDQDMRLWMRMDDINASGDPTDLSSYSINGSRQGNATQSSNGKFGDSFIFDGSGDFIQVSNASSLDITDAFSVNFWFKGNSSVTPQPLVTKWNGTANQIAWFVDVAAAGGICPSSPSLDFYISEDGGSSDRVYIRNCNATYQDNTWHMVTGTFDPGNSIKLYVDGVETGTSTGNISTVNGIYSNNNPLQIGAGAGYSTNYNGSIDEVLLFARSLTSQEVLSLYGATVNQYSNNFSNLSYGHYDFIGHAVDVRGNRNMTEFRTVAILSPINVREFAVTYGNATQRVFKFLINNTLTTSLSNISWSLDTGNGNKTSQYNITLQSGENAIVFAYHNYMAFGNYTVRATAQNAQYSDTEVIQIQV